MPTPDAPGLLTSRILDGGGRWVQQERPTETNRLLTGRLGSPRAAQACTTNW
ncbi:hypothetical protein ACFYWX_43360 [Streptomyces sp. NPDC002888]|uniref:hypothetical protein n=1 Tax=Streptomyces sp. NPDC002888 TaxID=3364668 RepID=UPI0036ABD7DD